MMLENSWYHRLWFIVIEKVSVHKLVLNSLKGELFNQNENAFYLFEPLAAIQSEMSTMGCDKMIEDKIKYVLMNFSQSKSL